ncbi:MAG: hypothetical protein PSN37_03560 [Alphaproteobacteria bacterium]|nr:hypothetical protein [Alphaproteobacteria bacterium]
MKKFLLIGKYCPDYSVKCLMNLRLKMNQWPVSIEGRTAHPISEKRFWQDGKILNDVDSFGDFR